MKAFQFIKRHVLDGILIVVVGALVISLATGYKPLFILTDSMVPTLKVHQFALARRVDNPQTLIIGDICSYKTNLGITITHRIIDIDGDTFTFKGDNNNAPDDPVTADRIVYKVVAY